MDVSCDARKLYINSAYTAFLRLNDKMQKEVSRDKDEAQIKDTLSAHYQSEHQDLLPEWPIMLFTRQLQTPRVLL